MQSIVAQTLNCLQISVEAHQDTKDGYKLAFHFADNVYFNAAVLEKQINFVTDLESGSQSCYTSGSKPKWKQQVLISVQLYQAKGTQKHYCSLLKHIIWLSSPTRKSMHFIA